MAGKMKNRPQASTVKKGKTAQAAKTASNGKKAKLSALDAAARVLSETKQAMTCAELIAVMAAKGYWKSPGGQTPEATLYSGILRELQTKKGQARFRKTERGKFALA
jgi:hypothetical protein